MAALAGCDAVVHLAAAADVDEVATDPLGAEQTNARGTASVLEAARRAGVGRVVYASTIWVYSDVEAAVVDEDTPLRAPAHLYTATKLAGELYCRSYRELYDLDTVVLRFGIPYGPRARPAAVVPAMVGRALAGEPLTVAGDGAQTRRFVYVEDLADGVVRALGAGGRGPHLQPGRRARRVDPRGRRDGARGGRGRRDPPRGGAQRRLPRRRGRRLPRRARARLEPGHRLRRRGTALRRLGPPGRGGRAPDARRGRPAPAAQRARPGGGPRRPGGHPRCCGLGRAGRRRGAPRRRGDGHGAAGRARVAHGARRGGDAPAGRVAGRARLRADLRARATAAGRRRDARAPGRHRARRRVERRGAACSPARPRRARGRGARAPGG